MAARLKHSDWSDSASGSCFSQEPEWVLCHWGLVSPSWALLGYWCDVAWFDRLPAKLLHVWVLGSCGPFSPHFQDNLSSESHTRFRSEGTADHLVQPLAQSRVSNQDNSLLVRGWVRWILTSSLVLEKGQWTSFSSWHEGQPFMNQVGWHFACHHQPCHKQWCQSGSIPADPFNHGKTHWCQNDSNLCRTALVPLGFRD